MSVEAAIRRDPDGWNELVDRSTGATPFHRYEALATVADHADAELFPFVGTKGEEPIGLFPVYSKSAGPVRGVFSPPPALEVSYLGPVRLDDGAKQRKAERRHRRFAEAVLDALDDAVRPHYTHVRAGTGYDDPRPFIWSGFDPLPRYTYLVDLTPDAEDLLRSFSRDVRRNVRRAGEGPPVEIEEAGPAAVDRIVRGVAERHAEQDVFYGVTPSFARDLGEALPAGTMRAYSATSEGRFVGGLITIEDGRTIYRWQSYADLEFDAPVSDLLDWEVISRALDRDVERLDLVGANEPRLCGYKAKFNPAVRSYYSLERSSLPIDALKSLYLRFR